MWWLWDLVKENSEDDVKDTLRNLALLTLYVKNEALLVAYNLVVKAREEILSLDDVIDTLEELIKINEDMIAQIVVEEPMLGWIFEVFKGNKRAATSVRKK